MPPIYDAQVRYGSHPNSQNYAGRGLHSQQSSMAGARAQEAESTGQSLVLRRAEISVGAEMQEAVHVRAVKSGAYGRPLVSTDDEMRTVAFEEHFQPLPDLGRQAHADERHNCKPVRVKQPSANLNDALDAFYLPHQRVAVKPEEALYSAEADEALGISSNSRFPLSVVGIPLKNAAFESRSDDSRLCPREGQSSQTEHLMINGIPIDDFFKA